MTVTVSLLGPPRIERDGTPVALDTRKALALLAYLALTGRSHSRDALAELLWPGHDAERARGALRRTLSTLRAAVGGQHVDAGRERVALAAGPDLVIDVHRFRALAAEGAGEGDLAAAAELCAGGLLEGFSIRGSPGFEHWQLLEADALRRELGGVLDRLMAARSAPGDHAGGIRYARRRLELDPLHEPAHRELIRQLAWSGDRAAALTQYRACVRHLSAELGVPPARETTDLYRAISEGDLEPPRVPSAPPAPPSAKAGERPLVGRSSQWRALEAAAAAVGPDGRAVVLEGEAGIGKTRLAEAFLQHAAGRGAPTLSSRCYEEEAGLAYAPLVEALRGRLRADAAWLGGVPERSLAEAARLLPEIDELRPVPVPSAPADGPGAEGRFLAGLSDTLVAASAGPSPGVLLIDDLQWADEATLTLLGYLLRRRLAGRPLLLLLTWRPPRHARLRRLAAETGGVEVLVLPRLSADEVAELVRAAGLPASSGDLERRLFEETEGMPYLLVEYLDALADAPGGEPSEWPLPAGARELIRARTDALGDVARQVLGAAAVLGRSFDLDTVRDTGGRSEDETVTALEDVLRRGLVEEQDPPAHGAPVYDFGHEKVHAVVYGELTLARRRLLHRRAAAAVARHGSPRGERAALVARHLRLAGRDADAAVEYARAAEHARAVHANADALEHLRTALALGHPDRARLHAESGDLLVLLGDYPGALASFETAAAGADGTGGLAALEHRLGEVHRRRGEWDLAQARLAAALEAADPGDDALRSRVHADLSLVAHARRRPAEAAEHADTARRLADRGGDAGALAQALNILGVLARRGGDSAAARRHLERSAALADELGDPAARAAALNNLGLTLGTQGDREPAIGITRTALELCAVHGDRHREAALHNNLADLLHDAGATEESMEHQKRAMAIFAEIGRDAEPQPEIWKLVEW